MVVKEENKEKSCCVSLKQKNFDNFEIELGNFRDETIKNKFGII